MIDEKAIQFLDDVEAGRPRVTGNKQLDAMVAACPDDPRWDRLRTVPNPRRVGVLDQYIATLAPVHVCSSPDACCDTLCMDIDS